VLLSFLQVNWVHFQALQEVMQGVLYDQTPEVTLTFVLLLPQETCSTLILGKLSVFMFGQL
jgi:hypothetical protein